MARVSDWYLEDLGSMIDSAIDLLGELGPDFEILQPVLYRRPDEMI